MTVRAGFVLLAGGMGSRMGADVNKVYLEVDGRNILEYSLAVAAGNTMIVELVLVIRPEDQEHLDQLDLTRFEGAPIRTTYGGATRHESEYAGIAALRSEIECGALDVVAVHDGARPFMSDDLLVRTLQQAAAVGSALPACPINDHLFLLDQAAFADPDDHVWVQTPQAFDAVTLLAAHDAAAPAGFHGVDTAEVVQRFSDHDIQLIAGERTNLKVTYQRDLSSAKTVAAAANADPVTDPSPGSSS